MVTGEGASDTRLPTVFEVLSNSVTVTTSKHDLSSHLMSVLYACTRCTDIAKSVSLFMQ